MKRLKKILVITAVIITTMVFSINVDAASEKTEALRAYAAYLNKDSIKRKVDPCTESSLDYYDLKECKFAIEKIDGDDIPELIIINSNYDALVCAYHGGKVVQLIEFWVNYRDMRTTYYYPKTGYIRNEYETGDNYFLEEYYEIDSTILYAKKRYNMEEEWSDNDGNGVLDKKFFEYEAYKNEDPVLISESDFYDAIKQYTERKKAKKFVTYNNTKAKRREILKSVDGSIPASLNSVLISLDKGKTYQLKLKGAAGKVSWSSSNKKIATVSSNGKVTAKGSGMAYVSAKYNGKKYECCVRVSSQFYTTPKGLYPFTNGGFYLKINSVGWTGFTYSYYMPYSTGSNLSANINPDGKTAVSYITCSKSNQSHKLTFTIVSNGIRVTESTNCSSKVMTSKTVNFYPEWMMDFC